MIQPPGLYVFGIAFLFFRRRLQLLGLGFLVFAAICIATKAYPSRIVYFLPYALIGTAIGVTSVWRRRSRAVLMCVVALMLVFAYGRTYICRNLTDYRVRHRMDYAALRPVIEQELGRDISVYADTFQLYCLGRELNWKQYHYLAQWVLPPTNLLAKVDYCISNAEGEKKGFVQHLTDNGFKFAFRIEQPIPEFDWLTRHIPPLGGHEPFLGPYNVYQRAGLARRHQKE